jgi:hypothetical protein
MPKRQPAGNLPQRKKSVSKASASKGREDSRAAKVKDEKDARSRKAHETGAGLAEHYKEREQDVDQLRKVHRPPSKKKSKSGKRK